MAPKLANETSFRWQKGARMNGYRQEILVGGSGTMQLIAQVTATGHSQLQDPPGTR
jgi:hypothetical protein